MKISLAISICLLGGLLIVSPKGAAAQSQPAAAPETSAAPPKLGAQEERGKGIYLQKCALCHAPKIQKPRTVPALAPIPPGLLKGAGAVKEPAVRQLILKGTPNMPGFQYGLEPKDLDDLIAYMKTI